MNRSQGLKQSLLRPSSSKNKHSYNSTPYVQKEENVSYAAGEKGTPSLNLQNDSDFNVGVNEDDHLTLLEPQGSTDKSVCTPSLDEEGREDERTVDHNIEQPKAEIDGSKSMNNKKRRCTSNHVVLIADKLEEWREVGTYFHNGPVGENHNLITRYMGMLVKDHTVCPVRVHSCNDIDESAKEQMQAAVKACNAECSRLSMWNTSKERAYLTLEGENGVLFSLGDH
ncbi:hypothetical protein Cgig2_018962 [Carnegiea gigantea]|uniref:Uncharacterized protein n=1 Tax=Carnegiea gigantea TaxID=171969 RepID=A0A9Q1QB33_9CARY|nr:hypothetical protein Cgig2_018962 [Carnegiea gigantea]